MEQRIITEQKLNAFYRYLQEEEKSVATREKYLREVCRFSAYLSGEAVTKAAVARWKEALLQKGCSPSTVNGKLTAVDQFFLFLGWGDCRVRHLKLQRRLFRDDSRDLTKAEYKRLVGAAEETGKRRLALLMETICGTGIRVSEVRSITVEAVRQEKAEIALKGKIRTILIPHKLAQKLLDYAKRNQIASGEIFLSKDGRSLNRKQIWAEMKAVCQRANVTPSKVFPHNLRHLFARTFYHICRDVAKLADMLGHSSMETTRIYLISTGTEHARALERLQLVS